MQNFCTWTDANAFMRTCFITANMSIPEQRNAIEVAHSLESPLEVVMFSAILTAERSLKFQPSTAATILEQIQADNMLEFTIRPAVPVGTYRADMIMAATMCAKIAHDSDQPSKVVIECDGYNFHDKTRDQSCRDRARDRYMQREGYIVARFAGDEIVDQPFECALEAFDLALRGIVRVRRDVTPDGGWPVFRRTNNGHATGPISLRMFDLNCDRQDYDGAETVNG